MTSPYLFELNLASYLQKDISERKYFKAISPIIFQHQNDLIDLLFDAFSERHTQDEQARLAVRQNLHNYFSSIVHSPILNCSWGY